MSITLADGATYTDAVYGVTNGSDAGAGQIGQVLQTLVPTGSSVALSNGVSVVVASVAYTAGEWMVNANPAMNYTTFTSTTTMAFISTASGDNTTGIAVDNTAYISRPTATSSGVTSGNIDYLFSATTSGTLYLKINSAFSGGSATAFGSITMRRIR